MRFIFSAIFIWLKLFFSQYMKNFFHNIWKFFFIRMKKIFQSKIMI